MTCILILLLIQGALGALDTIWHHELGGLPGRPSAARELALHGAREAIYAVVFLTIGWVDWTGAFAVVLAALLLVELGITLTDFVEEDRTRRLPPTERVLHTLMAIGFGVILAAWSPILLAWGARPTGFSLAHHGPLAWATTALGLGVAAWALRDTLATLHLGRIRPPPSAAAPSGHSVLITGATGFIGGVLVEDRLARGDRVLVLARDLIAARARFGPTVLVYDDLAQVPSDIRLDAVINLAGAATVGGLWTKARKARLLGSRLAVTDAVLALIARLETRPQVLVNASAVGFYGDRGDELLDEAAGPQDRFLSDLCRIWEERALQAQGLGVRTCLLRLGMVFDWSGGPLPLLALPARFGLGMVMGSGRQHLPWIHRDDVLALIDFAIREPACSGPLNACAPEEVRQGDFAHRLARGLHRPQWLGAPAWALRLAMGEFADLFLASQRISPARLQALGFRFARGTIAQALQTNQTLQTKTGPGPASEPRERLAEAPLA